MTPETALPEHDIERLVHAFYDKVALDPVLGPIFARVVHDWPGHKATLVSFWCSIERRAGRYRGNPMAAHRPLPIEAGHFERWLALWNETARELLPPADAERLYQHACRIARSLQYGLGLDPNRRPLGLPTLAPAVEPH